MNKQPPLFTAIVIHYNNGDYIYETLDSILAQDYPNIELLISDDHSPDGFDVDRVIRYINAHRGENIKRVVINRNPRNLGTVRHLEVIRAKVHGEYEALIAADDIWTGPTIFSAFAKRFEELGPKGEWLVSQVEMCDETLQSCESLFVPENVIRLARAEDCKGLLEVEAAQCLLPAAGSVFRRSFFEKVNGLSKDYYLIEDYTTHLRALRQNIVPYWTDVVSVKHRAGGISHGNKHNGALLYARYQHDFVTAFEREIEPYKDRISPAAYAKALDLYRYNLRAYKDALRKVRQVQRIVKPEEEKHLTPLPRRVFLAAYGRLDGFCRSYRMLDNLKAIAFLLLCAVLWQMGPAGALMVEGVRLLRLLTVLMTAVLVMRLAVNFWLRLCKWQEERMPRE